MKQILRTKSLDANEKLSRYQETLRRYLHFISVSSKINKRPSETFQPQFEEKLIPTEFKQEIIDDQQEIKPSNTSTDILAANNVNSEDEQSEVEDDDANFCKSSYISLYLKRNKTLRKNSLLNSLSYPNTYLMNPFICKEMMVLKNKSTL